MIINVYVKTANIDNKILLKDKEHLNKKNSEKILFYKIVNIIVYFFSYFLIIVFKIINYYCFAKICIFLLTIYNIKL